MIVIDQRELDALTELFHYRAQTFVQDAISEGVRRAQAYAASGGRHRDPHDRRYVSRGMRRKLRRATSAQVASMQEKVFYRRFSDFFDPTL